MADRYPTPARAAVRNAADPQQVRRAAQKDREREDRWLAALKATLTTVAGRHMCWELLCRAGVYRSIWDPSAKIHYNAGRQDFGHELLAEILRADPALYQLMETEARTAAAAESRALDALQQGRAATQEEEDDHGSDSSARGRAG